MNGSNNDPQDPEHASPMAELSGRWTDEGLPLSVRRRLLHKEVEQLHRRSGGPAPEPRDCNDRPK